MNDGNEKDMEHEGGRRGAAWIVPPRRGKTQEERTALVRALAWNALRLRGGGNDPLFDTFGALAGVSNHAVNNYWYGDHTLPFPVLWTLLEIGWSRLETKPGKPILALERRVLLVEAETCLPIEEVAPLIRTVRDGHPPLRRVAVPSALLLSGMIDPPPDPDAIPDPEVDRLVAAACKVEQVFGPGKRPGRPKVAYYAWSVTDPATGAALKGGKARRGDAGMAAAKNYLRRAVARGEVKPLPPA